MATGKTSLLLVVAFFLLNTSQAGFFKSGLNQNGTRGFLSFLFGRPRICNCLCGRPNRVNARLQSGEYAQTHEFPWLVAIILNGTRISSGVLINDRYVITANGPLAGLTPYQVKVTLGANDRCRYDISSVNDSVSSIIVLPNYDARTGNHDIALLKLTNPVTFNQNINPICLPDANARYLGQVVTIVSWGQEPNATTSNTSTAASATTNSTTSSTSSTSSTTSSTTTSSTTAAPAGRRRRNADTVNYDGWFGFEDDGFWDDSNFRVKRQTIDSGILCLPKKLGLPVLGEGRCPDANVNSQQISGDTGCAGISGAQNQVCSADTGAPVMFRDHRGVYQLVGVISAINNCVNSTMPTLYTRLNSYVSWIYSNTQDACYCSQSLKFGFY